MNKDDLCSVSDFHKFKNTFGFGIRLLTVTAVVKTYLRCRTKVFYSCDILEFKEKSTGATTVEYEMKYGC